MLVKEIYTGSTRKGVSLVEKEIEKIGGPEECIYARIRYVPSRGIGSPAPLEYPLVLYTTGRTVICCADVTAGYGGTGPQGMVELLDYLGFDFYDEDILANRKKVQLDLVKPGYEIRDIYKSFDFPKKDWACHPVK